MTEEENYSEGSSTINYNFVNWQRGFASACVCKKAGEYLAIEENGSWENDNLRIKRAKKLVNDAYKGKNDADGRNTNAEACYNYL